MKAGASSRPLWVRALQDRDVEWNTAGNERRAGRPIDRSNKQMIGGSICCCVLFPCSPQTSTPSSTGSGRFWASSLGWRGEAFP